MDSNFPVRFLHIADIHLGCRQYHSKERQRDFYLALDSVISRYALPLEEGGENQVDFVIIPGDLFDQRNLQPITLSRATDVLSRLQDAGIPVLASEGNHDAARRHEPNEPNWYNFLCSEGFLIYLQDYIEEGDVIFEPWSDDDRAGGYYDFPNGVRVVGTQWYGAQAHAMIERIQASLSTLPPSRFTILMFHGGLTDYVNTLSAGVDYEQLLPLREVVDYLALGHIHKRYERQGWVFNPGSLEACKIQEYFDENGAYRITLHEDGCLDTEHLTDYFRRPFIWLELSCELLNTPDEVEAAIRELVAGEGVEKAERIKHDWPSEIPHHPPICHIEFRGSLGFPFSKIPMRELEPWICEMLEAEMLRFHNDTTPRELGGAEALPMREGRIDRDALERHVFASLFQDDSRYKEHAEPLATMAVELKQQLIYEQLDEQQQHAFAQEMFRVFEGEIPTDTSETSTSSEELEAFQSDHVDHLPSDESVNRSSEESFEEAEIKGNATGTDLGKKDLDIPNEA